MQETPPSPAEPVAASPTPVETPEGSVPAGAEVPVSDGAAAPAAEAGAPAAESADEPMTEPAAEAATEPTTEPTTEPVAEATATPAPPAVPELSPAACAAALAERFPALFAAVPPLPIKLRIQADIQERAPGVFSRRSLSLFLHRHTTSTAYIRALVQAQTRFDLDGQPAGEIATEHREAAVLELERRKAIVMAKRQAERAAMRPAQPPGGPAAEGEARPPRPPRPPRRDGPPRPSAPQGAGPAAGPRPERPQRSDRPDRPARAEHAPRPERHARPLRPPIPGQPMQPRPDRHDGPPREPRPVQAPHRAESPRETVPASPDAEARRSRALLLRAYETSTISRANFCVLKRLSETELEAQLQQARAERGEHAPAAAPRAETRSRR
jgi:ProP effector